MTISLLMISFYAHIPMRWVGYYHTEVEILQDDLISSGCYLLEWGYLEKAVQINLLSLCHKHNHIASVPSKHMQLQALSRLYKIICQVLPDSLCAHLAQFCTVRARY